MAESGNSAIGIKISGDTVPAGKSVVRTKLYHAERDLCSGIGITGEIGSDKWVYILGIVNSCLFRGRRTGSENK